jgi:peroxiredoxin
MNSNTKISTLLVAAGFLAACAGPTGGDAGGRARTEAMPPSAVGEGVDEARAPDFELVAVDGRTIRLSDSAGKVRLLDFWATWCAPCREEIPMLNDLHDAYASAGLEIFAISDEGDDVIREFVKDYEIRYTNLLGTVEVSEEYGVLGLPTAYLVDSEGRIVESFVGPKPRKVLTEKILALLDAS